MPNTVTVKTPIELRSVTKHFKRAIKMHKFACKEHETEKMLMYVALFSDDILDGAKIFDDLMVKGCLNGELEILVEDRQQLDELVEQAEHLEEEAKRQLDQLYNHKIAELFKVKNKMNYSTPLFDDLEIMVARLESFE